MSSHVKESSPFFANVVAISPACPKSLDFVVFLFSVGKFSIFMKSNISVFYGFWASCSSLQDYDHIHWRFDLVLMRYFFFLYLNLCFVWSLARFSQIGCWLPQQHLFATQMNHVFYRELSFWAWHLTAAPGPGYRLPLLLCRSPRVSPA